MFLRYIKSLLRIDLNGGQTPIQALMVGETGLRLEEKLWNGMKEGPMSILGLDVP